MGINVERSQNEYLTRASSNTAAMPSETDELSTAALALIMPSMVALSTAGW